MFLILMNRVFILTFFPFSHYFPRKNTYHVGISQKNKMAWCKISMIWIDTYCDNYILPLKSFHDSLIYLFIFVEIKGFFFKLIFIGVYSCFIVLLAAAQQSESVIVYIYPLLFRFPPHLSHHRALSRAPCAIQ